MYKNILATLSVCAIVLLGIIATPPEKASIGEKLACLPAWYTFISWHTSKRRIPDNHFRRFGQVLNRTILLRKSLEQADTQLKTAELERLEVDTGVLLFVVRKIDEGTDGLTSLLAAFKQHCPAETKITTRLRNRKKALEHFATVLSTAAFKNIRFLEQAVIHALALPPPSARAAELFFINGKPVENCKVPRII